jgi:hypothetical protein
MWEQLVHNLQTKRITQRKFCKLLVRVIPKQASRQFQAIPQGLQPRVMQLVPKAEMELTKAPIIWINRASCSKVFIRLYLGDANSAVRSPMPHVGVLAEAWPRRMGTSPLPYAFLASQIWAPLQARVLLESKRGLAMFLVQLPLNKLLRW